MATQPDIIAPTGPVSFSPQQPKPAQTATGQPTLADLLQFEGDLRRQATLPELLYFVANDARRIVAHDQMFILRQSRLGEGFAVETISSLAVVDRNTPFIQAVEQCVTSLIKAGTLSTSCAFDAVSMAGEHSAGFADYPFHAMHWHPIKSRDDSVFAGLLLARTTALETAELVRLDRIAESTAHSWLALTANRPVNRIARLGKRERRSLLILAAGIALFPVQMTALAPVEVVAARPFVISAPFAGVISTIDVLPNAHVRKGQLLMRFDDIKFRNEQSLAQQKAQVAAARVERSTTASFAKAEEGHDIGINQAEAQLATADVAYAKDMMAKTQIRAPRDGIVIYTDRKDWEGRAVNVGEPIMQVADPRNVSLRIDLPARAQMTLEPNSRVKIWLDSQPFWAIDAVLQTASYQARQTPDNVLAFALTATPVSEIPRIGSRGTAQVRGHWAPLAYSLLKRPIASFRQYFGI
jgi:Barrel-sandwich domain of CusB or HlyD membrane-fusion